jgi:hypothetical protein
MALHHFFHVFADGSWRLPLGEHLAALKHSGLARNLDGFYYGVVGSEDRRKQVKKVLPGECVAEAETGWEQVTLSKVREFAQHHSGLLLYGHTKGAGFPRKLADLWRRSMIYDNVVRWQEAVEGLQQADVAGSHWLTSPDHEHKHHRYFFGGNYWWAHLDYLRTLPPVGNDHRHQAEGWIGLRDPKPFILRDGYAHGFNMRQEPLPFDAVEI